MSDQNTASALSPKSPDPQVDTARAAPGVLSDDVRAAEIKAQEAEAKAADAAKTPEQRKADKARADADDARAQAAADQAAAPEEPMTVEEAKVHAPVPLDMGAGDHMAQKFGNDPENPKIAKGEHADPELSTVTLTRITPDHPDRVVTKVHPEMAGDYIRAGWERS